MRAAIFLAIVFIFPMRCRGEFPALEKRMSAKLSLIAETIGTRTVLVSTTETTRAPAEWDLPAAIETEIVAQLLVCGVKATDDDADNRVAWLAKANRKSASKWRKQDPVHDMLLIARLRGSKNSPSIEIELFNQKSSKPIREVTIKLDAEDTSLAKNLPERNQKVVEFIRTFDGGGVGDGHPMTAVNEALRAAECNRFGSYFYGRELGPKEALLPGDILSFDRARLFLDDNRREVYFGQHAAIVGDVVGPGMVRIFHQGYRQPTITSAELNLNNLRSGKITAYRPVKRGESQMPMTQNPIRKSAVEVDWSRPVDLLETIDPEIDSLRGTWGKWDGPLWCNREKQGKIQIPVDLPDSYLLKITAKRVTGVNSLTILPVIGGRQATLTIDGFNGKITGLGLIDGKMENKNATTKRTIVFPLNKKVELELHVTPNRLLLTANNKDVLKWEGDPKSLSLSRVHTVPNKNWIHLGSYDANLEISAISVERLR